MGLLAFLLFAGVLGCVWALLHLTSGKANAKSENTTVKSRKTMQEVIDTLRRAAVELNAAIDKIDDDPFGASNGLAVVLHGEEKGVSRNTWAVQVYATETERGCEIELVALGEGLSAGYARTYGGIYYAGRISLASSKKRRDIIAGRLY